jgi:pimeloyl-ACP methyl ester carboxylesterase
LAQDGFVAFCIDLPCFGDRQTDTESALAKRYLWQGDTLFGAMLADLRGALAVLEDIDGVDRQRIGAFGISMGATLAVWLGALEPRITAVAHLCCFADLAMLIETGAHDLHGNYMTVPGLTKTLSTGAIAGLIAPRPQLACIGLLDPLTPELAATRALDDARAAYQHCGAPDAISAMISTCTGHAETPDMRAAVRGFLAKCC